MKRTFAALLWLAGCAHTHPEEMTADEHRAEARAHSDKAKQEQAQYQDGRTVRFPSRTPFGEPGDWAWYNPTEHHLNRADSELRKSAAHSAAAQALESFEDAACQQIPRAERAACPLLASWVSQIQETRTGLRLVLKGNVDSADVNRRLNCHLAYARASGFDRPSCPLFMKGMAIAVEQAGVLAVTGEDAEVARKLQVEARKIFTGEAAVPVSSR
jgi:hypothetical protein